MAFMSIKQMGFEELRRELERKGEDVEAATEAALMAGAEVMLDRMQQFADEAFESRSGDLRGAIKIKSLSTRMGSVKVGVWSDDVYYAYYVEYGHAPPGKSKRPRDWGSNLGITNSKGRKGKRAVKARREEMAARSKGGDPTPPHPFIMPAYYSGRFEAREAIGETLKREAGL